jgi:hypothetical protein
LDSNRKAQFHNVLSEPGYRNEFIAEKTKIYKKNQGRIIEEEEKISLVFAIQRERET